MQNPWMNPYNLPAEDNAAILDTTPDQGDDLGRGWGRDYMSDETDDMGRGWGRAPHAVGDSEIDDLWETTYRQLPTGCVAVSGFGDEVAPELVALGPAMFGVLDVLEPGLGNKVRSRARQLEAQGLSRQQALKMAASFGLSQSLYNDLVRFGKTGAVRATSALGCALCQDSGAYALGDVNVSVKPGSSGTGVARWGFASKQTKQNYTLPDNTKPNAAAQYTNVIAYLESHDSGKAKDVREGKFPFHFVRDHRKASRDAYLQKFPTHIRAAIVAQHLPIVWGHFYNQQTRTLEVKQWHPPKRSLWDLLVAAIKWAADKIGDIIDWVVEKACDVINSSAANRAIDETYNRVVKKGPGGIDVGPPDLIAAKRGLDTARSMCSRGEEPPIEDEGGGMGLLLLGGAALLAVWALR